jgi:hypothetical protein
VSVSDPTTVCRDMQCAIFLYIQKEHDPNDYVVVKYEYALNQAILDGRLQNELHSVNANSHARVILESKPVVKSTPPPVQAGGSSLSRGATAAIVVGVLAFLLLPAVFFLLRRRENTKNIKEPDEVHTSEELAAAGHSSTRSVVTDHDSPTVVMGTLSSKLSSQDARTRSSDHVGQQTMDDANVRIDGISDVDQDWKSDNLLAIQSRESEMSVYTSPSDDKLLMDAGVLSADSALAIAKTDSSDSKATS